MAEMHLFLERLMAKHSALICGASIKNVLRFLDCDYLEACSFGRTRCGWKRKEQDELQVFVDTAIDAKGERF